MRLADCLWQQNQALVAEIRFHPFVVALVEGSLPLNQFQAYIAQDAFFLEAFARAYSIAAAKSEHRADFEQFHQLAGGVLEELQLHARLAQRWQIDLRSVQPNPATRRYVDFLVATAWSRPLGAIAAAMVPCMRLYADLGQFWLKRGYAAEPYGEWVQTYADPAFKSLAQQLEALLDRHGTEAIAAEPYGYALTCERDFFSAVGSAIA
ncbi:TenA family protein [Synechococcus elongatus]|uniref:TenA family protein n=1 Tax=Synechococcus elongatus PCC 11802 TaxID=2283154 RepID=A0AAT9K0C5_SYNEL|nr:TenA family protein [Synechococcus elongatus]QFZ92115.1 TenA family protein [Synechococcus elongatus PCC 11802]